MYCPTLKKVVMNFLKMTKEEFRVFELEKKALFDKLDPITEPDEMIKVILETGSEALVEYILYGVQEFDGNNPQQKTTEANVIVSFFEFYHNELSSLCPKEVHILDDNWDVELIRLGSRILVCVNMYDNIQGPDEAVEEIQQKIFNVITGGLFIDILLGLDLPDRNTLIAVLLSGLAEYKIELEGYEISKADETYTIKKAEKRE